MTSWRPLLKKMASHSHIFPTFGLLHYYNLNTIPVFVSLTEEGEDDDGYGRPTEQGDRGFRSPEEASSQQVRLRLRNPSVNDLDPAWLR